MAEKELLTSPELLMTSQGNILKKECKIVLRSKAPAMGEQEVTEAQSIDGQWIGLEMAML